MKHIKCRLIPAVTVTSKNFEKMLFDALDTQLIAVLVGCSTAVDDIPEEINWHLALSTAAESVR